MGEELSYSPFSRPVAHFPERANEEAASSTCINILSGSHDDTIVSDDTDSQMAWREVWFGFDEEMRAKTKFA